MKFEILKAAPEHLDLLTPLFNAYRIFYRQPSDLSAARSFMNERLEQNDSEIFIAISNEGESQRGAGFVQLYPSFSSVSVQKLWILNDLYVAEAARRTGVGEALMNRARRHAEESSAKGLTLATWTDNHPAQALYESLGYVRDTEFYHYALTL